MRAPAALAVLAFSLISCPVAGCDGLAPAANRWAGCAQSVLPVTAVLDADGLSQLRNDSLIHKNIRPDARGEQRWNAQWRARVTRQCGALKDAQARDVREKQVGVPPPFDEIYAIPFWDRYR